MDTRTQGRTERKAEYILEIVNLSKDFPGVRALKNVNLSFAAGEIHALVGENGAGKSTLMKILSGVYHPTSGSVLFKGKPFKVKNPHEAQLLGISIIYQEFSLIRNFTVMENVFLNREPASGMGLLNRRDAKEKIENLLEEIGIELDADATVASLSVVQQQVVEIIKALSVEAGVLIMDEPSATLTDLEIKKLFDIIRHLKSKGVTVIYISHMLDEVFEIADRVTVLKDGEVMDTRNTAELTKTDLIRLMVGRKIEDYYPSFHGEQGAPVLEARRLSGDGISDISFSLRAGEVIGIAGMMGSGQENLVRCILGLDPHTSGEILLHGKRVAINGIRKAIQNGIGYISEDRKNQGILGPLGVRENITIANLPAYAKYGILNRRREVADSGNQVDALRIKVSGLGQRLDNLSGGNQQKVLIGRWLVKEPSIYIFSEPTRGIDVGAKAEIYRIMRDLTRQGKSIIMISSELPEIIGISDRILVMRSGKSAGILDQAGGTVTEEEIMSLAVGHEYSLAGEREEKL